MFFFLNLKFVLFIFSRIIHYMDSSTKTLDVCMYIVTCQEIINAISRAHKRKVNVRVIADASMSENSACGDQLTRLRRTGIYLNLKKKKIIATQSPAQ